jgi:hypothetical protein
MVERVKVRTTTFLCAPQTESYPTGDAKKFIFLVMTLAYKVF